ncbi:hypothetical protein Golob_024390, partial [Gossypium lobatum]|nr:hypothetical protein [Gossypium lobatum]
GSEFLARGQYRPLVQVGPETHQRVCGELQLGLSIDGSVPTRSAQFAEWGAICYDRLDAFPDNIYRDHQRLFDARQVMKYRTFEVATETHQFRAAGKLNFGSAVLATLYWETCRITQPNKIKIGGRIALLQLLAHFRFSFLCLRVDQPYTFPFNPNIGHVRVPLVSYATIEMHQTNRVLHQFRFRQPIPVALEVLDDEHKIDLRQSDTDWPLFHSKYIEMWKNQYDNIPTHELIIISELVCDPDYMPWFRIHGKPYLLLEEGRPQ